MILIVSAAPFATFSKSFYTRFLIYWKIYTLHLYSHSLPQSPKKKIHEEKLNEQHLVKILNRQWHLHKAVWEWAKILHQYPEGMDAQSSYDLWKPWACYPVLACLQAPGSLGLSLLRAVFPVNAWVLWVLPLAHRSPGAKGKGLAVLGPCWSHCSAAYMSKMRKMEVILEAYIHVCIP